MDFKDIKIYGSKSMADLFKEIHKKNTDKESELRDLINDLKPYIKTAGDALVIVPLITKYLDISIKNDDNLIKMVGIVQRVINSSSNSENLEWTDKDKDALLDEIKNMQVV